MLLLPLPRQAALLFLATLPYIKGQQQSNNAPTASSTPTSSLPVPTSTSYTTYTSVFATTLTSGQPRPSGAPTSQSVFLATTTVTSALFTSTSSTALPSPSASIPVPSSKPSSFAETGLPLDTIIDPAFGILGVLLILSGATLAFIGHRSRWLVCLISGFYSFALVTICVILRVGVARAVNDPDKTLKGIYLLACICAGGIGGAAYVIFRQGGLLISSSLGGFIGALYLQALKSDGLIPTIALRYILYLGLAALAFSLACHSRLQSYVLIFSSAIVGSTAIVLGIDCFTRANLKEFYIRNLGFDDLFEKRYPEEFRRHHWYLSTASIIELGVIGGLTLMAISFQGKMWAEFRASLQLMRHDDEERRMQSRAKRAAKKIFASAQKDLREWEERHGYRKTVTRPEAEDKEYVVQSIPNSDMATYQTKGSTLSLLPMKTGQGSTPIIEYPPAIAYEPNVGESIGLLQSPTSGAASNLPELGDRQSGKQEQSPLTNEQQTLLEEIANIRKSIDVLRSASPGTAMSASSDYQDVEKRASSASLMRTSREESNAGRTPSPWQRRERTHSRSISTVMMEPSSVSPDLFAGIEGIPSVQRSSSPGLSSSVEEPQRPSSVMLPRLQPPSSEGRTRADSDSRLFQSIAAISPRSPITDSESKTVRRAMSPTTSQRGISHDTAFNPMHQDKRASRIIVETEEEAAARYAKSINREVPRNSNRSKKLTEPSSPVEYTKSSTMLSMGELQARHENRLKALQRPASVRVQEEASLIKAKEDWKRRSLMEKKRWEGIERDQKRDQIPMVQEERPRQSHRSKSLTPNMAPFPAAVTTSGTIQDLPEQSGVSRAREWRNSLRADYSEPTSPLPEAMRRRHSAHSQPLLDFTAETIQEEAKQTQQRS